MAMKSPFAPTNDFDDFENQLLNPTPVQQTSTAPQQPMQMNFSLDPASIGTVTAGSGASSGGPSGAGLVRGDRGQNNFNNMSNPYNQQPAAAAGQAVSVQQQQNHMMGNGFNNVNTNQGFQNQQHNTNSTYNTQTMAQQQNQYTTQNQQQSQYASSMPPHPMSNQTPHPMSNHLSQQAVTQNVQNFATGIGINPLAANVAASVVGQHTAEAQSLAAKQIGGPNVTGGGMQLGGHHPNAPPQQQQQQQYGHLQPQHNKPDSEGRQVPGGGLKMDVDDAELYIPLMGFLTYLVCFGLDMGLRDKFQPVIFATTLQWSVLVAIVENGLAKLAFAAINSAISIFDLVAFTGYKYFYLSILSIILLLLPKFIFYIFFIYCACACVFVEWRFLAGLQSYRTDHAREMGISQSTGPMHKKIILVIAVSQMGLIWFLLPVFFGERAAAAGTGVRVNMGT